MSAQEAIERAKAIAARLQQEATGGGGASATTSSTTTASGKRRRWGVAPDHITNNNSNTNNNTNINNNNDNDPKRAKTDAANTAETLSKRMWISTSSKRPAAHFVNLLKDDLEALSPKQLLDNPTEQDTATAALEGRGSGSAQQVMGMPLEPLHILIQASTQDLLSRAEARVDALLQQAEEAEVHPDLIQAAEDDDNAPRKTVASTSMALATIQDPASLTHSSQGGSLAAYKPASVAQLIGQADGAAGGGGFEETVLVPRGVLGFIIGKGGENIASLQSRTGAKVQVLRETDAASAQSPHRQIQVMAPSAEALAQAKHLIQETVDEKSKLLSNNTVGGNMHRKDAQRLEEALSMGHTHVQVPVPDTDVGLVIGKGGSTIRSLQDRSGANIQVPSAQETQDGKRLIHITHPTAEGAEHAKKLIEELLANNANNNLQSGGVPTKPKDEVTATMLVPHNDVGLIIGRQGSVIKYLQESTGSKIQIPSECIPGQDQRLATITGSPNGVANAQLMIAQIISDQSSAGVMAVANTGGRYSTTGRATASDMKRLQQPALPSEGDKNYSAEWAAYHAAQAAAQASTPQAPAYGGYNAAYSGYYQGQPQQQQQQPPQGTYGATSGAAAPAPAAPASDAYYEQFFRYAYYYGEPAARQYYGAWSPPAGTPNPYGVNPNIQPAPAATPAATDAPANAPPPASQPESAPPAASSQQGAVGRETSVRKVSNLPAWMNKS